MILSCWLFLQSRSASQWQELLGRKHNRAPEVQEKNNPCYLLFLENNQRDAINVQYKKKSFNNKCFIITVQVVLQRDGNQKVMRDFRTPNSYFSKLSK
jgi:hypothetical protein